MTWLRVAEDRSCSKCSKISDTKLGLKLQRKLRKGED